MTSLTLKPRMSEKAFGLSQEKNVYVFVVPLTANKQMVADAVTEQFKVTVERVKTAVVKGKVVQTPRKRARGIAGKRVDIKKAFVTLKDGDTLPFFDTPEDPKADKKTKKAAKEKQESK